MGRVTPDSHVGYDWMANRHLPSPDFRRLDWQHYGLRANKRKGRTIISGYGEPRRERSKGHSRFSPKSYERARCLIERQPLAGWRSDLVAPSDSIRWKEVAGFGDDTTGTEPPQHPFATRPVTR